MKGIVFTYTEAGLTNDRTTLFARFRITTDEKVFELEETIDYPLPLPDTFETARLVQTIHLALGISYYKAFVPPEIVHPYALDESQVAFWNAVFRNGLGEFIYKNNLSFEQLATFKAQSGQETISSPDTIQFDESCIIGLGGGKDSIVAGELLKSINVPVQGFVQATGEQLGQTQAVADVMGIKLHAIKRKIDPQIIDINSLDGAYNGHIPISLIFALNGLLLATALKTRYVIVANESSASLPQATWQAMSINHQWSKSIEFERLLQGYIHDYVSKSLTYFSAIRPLTSIAVMKIFSEYPEYFEVFTSDNSLFAINPQSREHPRWSKESSKTLSSYILLAPWIDHATMIRIFGRDYLDDPKQIQRMKDLLGASDEAVLDCVGTPSELRACMGILKDLPEYANRTLVVEATNSGLADAGGMGEFMKLHESAIPEQLHEKIINAIQTKIGKEL